MSLLVVVDKFEQAYANALYLQDVGRIQNIEADKLASHVIWKDRIADLICC